MPNHRRTRSAELIGHRNAPSRSRAPKNAYGLASATSPIENEWSFGEPGLDKGALKKNLHQRPQKKKGGRTRQCPALCEVCLRPSAMSADVTHAVGVADLAPATEHAEASLFAPFAVVAAVLAPEARLFAPFGQLNQFSFDFEFELTLARCSSFMLAHGYFNGIRE